VARICSNCLHFVSAPGIADIKYNQGKKPENEFDTDFKWNCVYCWTKQRHLKFQQVWVEAARF